jgi:hypothetical protein
MQATPPDWETLTRDNIRQIVAAHLDDDPAAFALRHQGNDFPYALVSTQLKYLQRARHKLPSWYAVQAVIPPLAYEQASSEASAALKSLEGTRGLDLTLGLGVDSHYLAGRSNSVLGLEADATLAAIVRYNYALMGQTQVAVEASRAEDFLAHYDGSPFDWVYADPARRDSQGRRVQGLTQGQPDLPALWPRLRGLAQRLLIKASPLLDLRAAPQLLPGVCKLSVHSVNQEVKEVMVTVDLGAQAYVDLAEIPLSISLTDGSTTQHFSFDRWAETGAWLAPPATPTHLAEPDPAFYQAQCLPGLWQSYLSDWPAGLNDRMGYFLATSAAPSYFPGRRFVIEENWPYKPKFLKKALKAAGHARCHVMRRHFPLSVQQVRQQLNLTEGGDRYLICTTLGGEKRALLTRRDL